MISESFVLRWLLLAQTAAALLRAAPAHLFEASARLLLSTLAAQGPDGPPDEMLEPCRGHVQDMSETCPVGPPEEMLSSLALLWRETAQIHHACGSRAAGPGAGWGGGGGGAGGGAGAVPLEETLSCVLLKGLAGDCASERCRESALSALETLAEAHADRCRREYTRECPRVPERTRECPRGPESARD